MIENLLVLDTAFEPIDSDECELHQITLGGFHAGVRSETRGYAFDFYYTITFFVFKTPTGWKPASAVVHHIVCSENSSDYELSLSGCTVLDPEPIVEYYEIDFDRIIAEHERQSQDSATDDSESDTALVKRLLPTREFGLDIARGLYNVSWVDADLWVLAINTLVGAIEAGNGTA